MTYEVGAVGAHIGGSLSLVEIMSVLYTFCNINKNNLNKEDRDRITQKFVNGNRKQIVSDYVDVQIIIDLAPFDLETTYEYLQNLVSGEYMYYSLEDKQYKSVNMIIEEKPELTIESAVDNQIYTSDFSVTLLKASDV